MSDDGFHEQQAPIRSQAQLPAKRSIPKPRGSRFSAAIRGRAFSTPCNHGRVSAGRAAAAGARSEPMCASSARLRRRRLRDFGRASDASRDTARQPALWIGSAGISKQSRPTGASGRAGARGRLSPFTVQRLFKREMGVSPLGYQRALRARSLRSALKKGDTVTNAIYEAGFGSSSRA